MKFIISHKLYSIPSKNHIFADYKYTFFKILQSGSKIGKLCVYKKLKKGKRGMLLINEYLLKTVKKEFFYIYLNWNI